MAKKRMEGVEVANKIMLDDLGAFLVKRGFYLNPGGAHVDQSKKAKFDISKRGKLYKMLEEAGVKTRYDVAFKLKEKTSFHIFGEYAMIMKQYRNEVIKQSFKHRKDELK